MKKVFVYIYYQNLKDDFLFLDQVDYINLSFGVIKEKNGLFLLDTNNVLEALNKLKAKGLISKTILSIGGWGAGGFSEALENEELRKAFISSIIETVKRHNLAGIDLDWEYPTVSNAYIKGRMEDRHNFSILLKELKEALSKINPQLILSAAVPCGTQYYEVEEVGKYLDYLHIMSYDLDYGKDTTVHLAAPKNSDYTISSGTQGLNNWVSKGFDVKKIVLGCAFYVRRAQVENDFNNGLGQNRKTFETITYKNFTKLNIPTYIDPKALAEYAFLDNTFYSFDGMNSIKTKATIVKEADAAGIMCWEYNQDDEEHHLLRTMLKIKE